jgi:hypothetical protein
VAMRVKVLSPHLEWLEEICVSVHLLVYYRLLLIDIIIQVQKKKSASTDTENNSRQRTELTTHNCVIFGR